MKYLLITFSVLLAYFFVSTSSCILEVQNEEREGFHYATGDQADDPVDPDEGN